MVLWTWHSPDRLPYGHPWLLTTRLVLGGLHHCRCRITPRIPLAAKTSHRQDEKVKSHNGRIASIIIRAKSTQKCIDFAQINCKYSEMIQSQVKLDDLFYEWCIDLTGPPKQIRTSIKNDKNLSEKREHPSFHFLSTIKKGPRSIGSWDLFF